MLDKTLVDILACPKCRGSVRMPDDEENIIICDACSLAYHVDKDIPVMLIDCAVKYEKK